MAASENHSPQAAIQAPPSPLAEFWHYFRENKGAVVGLVVVVFLILLALLADVVAPHSPFEQFRNALLQPPAWEEGGSIATYVLGHRCDRPGHPVADHLRLAAVA